MILQPDLRRAAALALCLAFGAAHAQIAAKADPGHAQQAYVAGARLLERKDLAGAQAEFSRAATLDPAHAEYAMAVTLTRQHRIGDLLQQAAQARMSGQPDRANTLLAEARTIDPENEAVLEHLRDSLGAQQPAQKSVTPEIRFLPPIQLVPTAGVQDLDLRGNVRDVVTRAAQAYGIKAVFDDSVPTQTLRFNVDQLPYDQAMKVLLRMTHTFAVAIDAKTLFVVKDTEENRGKYERQAEETLYIPGSTKEQMDELINIIKNVFDVKQAIMSPTSGTIVVRAPEPTLTAVNYTLADMLDGGAEVMLEVKLITIAKSLTHNVGTVPPTSFSAFSVAQELQSFVSANQATITTAVSSGLLTLSGSQAQQLIQSAAFLIISGAATDPKLTNVIRFFGGGLTLFGTSISGGATFNFALSTSEARALDDINIRIGDRQTSTLKIGEKYPVTTATYSSGISSSTASALQGVTINGQSASALASAFSSAASVPQVQYEDLGITLKTTANVMRSNLIRLDLDMKIEALTGNSLNNIPILTSSNYTSNITVPEGDTVVMMSDLSSTQAASISGLPGLAELPGLNASLSDLMKETDSSELVLMITPHLVRKRNNQLASRAIPFHSSVPADF